VLRDVIPVRIEARDDLGLVYVRLATAEPPGSAGEQLQPLPLETPLTREALIDTQITPAAIGLQSGRALIVRAEAADAYNLEGQHVVRSVARKLTVITPEEKQRELVARQAGIAELLERSAELQSRALQQTRALQAQWRSAARRPSSLQPISIRSAGWRTISHRLRSACTTASTAAARRRTAFSPSLPGTGWRTRRRRNGSHDWSPSSHD
jgi:hypothetical protein